MSRLFVPALAAAAVWGLAAAAPLQEQPAPTAAGETGDELAFATDKAARMTVPVSIGGRGSYRFLVDTGSERTVISRELADRLALAPGRNVRLHSISEVANVETVVIPALNVSKRTVRDINAPALRQDNLGADGMLGVDSLQSQRVLFDFKKQTMSIAPARRSDYVTRNRDEIVVEARSRFGRLILADAAIDGERLWVIVDTGSQVTLGNEALRRKLFRKKKLGAALPIELTSVTGGKLTVDYARVRNLTIGGIAIADLHIAFADLQPFRKLDLIDRPAMLLGMDVLGLFDLIAVDFANRKVMFDVPDVSGLNPGRRMASLGSGSARGK